MKGFLHGEPESEVEYLDVTHMIETLVACYAEGVFFVDDGASLEMDDEGHDERPLYQRGTLSGLERGGRRR